MSEALPTIYYKGAWRAIAKLSGKELAEIVARYARNDEFDERSARGLCLEIIRLRKEAVWPL